MSQFVDEVALHVRGGDGGAGAVSFRREAHVPKGGPDGGDGGKGGDVWLVANRNVASLLAFRDHPHRRAGDGSHGMGKGRHGGKGADLEVRVPEGTVVWEGRPRTGEVAAATPASAPHEGESRRLLADLVADGDRWLAAEGGRGGRGNARFLSNRRRAPSFAEQGERGQQRWVRLELKLMADVALVGFPNAGKSTLISAVSAAHPKIADYPFTTLEPHLGVVRVGDTELVMADIPGLIKGASQGAGLGHRFLRHIERSRVLCVLIDLGPTCERSPADQEHILLDELRRYRPELTERPRVVVGSKADLVGETLATGTWDGLAISAVTGSGIQKLLGILAELVTEDRRRQQRPESFVVLRPDVEEGVQIERLGAHAFRVVGRPAERAVAVSDLTDAQALAYVHGRLRRLGVDRALARAGAQEGDLVHIGELSFTYEPDAIVGGRGS